MPLRAALPTYPPIWGSWRLSISAVNTARSCPVRRASTADSAASTADRGLVPVRAAMCGSASAAAGDDNQPDSEPGPGPGSAIGTAYMH